MNRKRTLFLALHLVLLASFSSASAQEASSAASPKPSSSPAASPTPPPTPAPSPDPVSASRSAIEEAPAVQKEAPVVQKDARTFEQLLDDQRASERDKGHLGLHLGLFGPGSTVDLSLSYGVSTQIEVLMSFGYGGDGEDKMGNQFVSGPWDSSLFATTLRARFVPWADPLLGGVHSPFVELGAGIAALSFSSAGQDYNGFKYTYDAGKTFPSLVAGLGYTWRAKQGLRLHISAGWMQIFGELNLPKVAADPAMNADWVEVMQGGLDKAARGEDDGRLYVELTAGWVF